MAIIIEWEDEERRKCPERLDIDPDHLDADEINESEGNETMVS